jgi:hypothetical protein
VSLCFTFGDAENVIPDIPKFQGKAVKLKGSVPVAIIGVNFSWILGRESDINASKKSHLYRELDFTL